MSAPGSCTASSLKEELGCLLGVMGRLWNTTGMMQITPAVLGGCITMGKGGGSSTSWVDTVVVRARDVGALN